MNGHNGLQKHTLLPSADEKSLAEMLDMFHALEELPQCKIHSNDDEHHLSPLRQDSVRLIMKADELAQYFPALEESGIAIPNILPPKEDGGHDRI